MKLRRALLSLTPIALVAVVSACSSAENPAQSNHDARLEASRERTQDIYAQSIDDVERRFERCIGEVEQTGKCEIDDEASGKTLTIVIDDHLNPAGFWDNVQKARELLGQVKQLLVDAKQKMCEIVAPFAGLQHPYFFYGGQLNGGAGVTAQIGADIVYDLWNQQAAVFSYKGVGAESLAGAEAGAYMGYGFGNKSSVLEAWSGRFCSATGSVGLKGIPGAGIGAFGSVFASPDLSVVGGSVGVSGYLGWSPPVGGAVYSSDWGAWNDATRGLNSIGWGYRTELKQDANGKEYIQYKSSVDMALGMLWNLPTPQNVAVATQVLAIDALKKTGLSIEQACPNEVANAKPPSIALAAGKLCGDIPNPLKDKEDGGEAGLSKTDCGDKADGWWCLDTAASGVPFMAYCQGRQIAGGCSCASCTTFGVKASCSADPPPAACPSE